MQNVPRSKGRWHPCDSRSDRQGSARCRTRRVERAEASGDGGKPLLARNHHTLRLTPFTMGNYHARPWKISTSFGLGPRKRGVPPLFSRSRHGGIVSRETSIPWKRSFKAELPRRPRVENQISIEQNPVPRSPEMKRDVARTREKAVLLSPDRGIPKFALSPMSSLMPRTSPTTRPPPSDMWVSTSSRKISRARWRRSQKSYISFLARFRMPDESHGTTLRIFDTS